MRLRWNIEFLRLRVVVRQRRRRDEYNLLQGLDAREDLRVVNEYAVIACMFSAQIDKGVGRLGGLPRLTVGRRGCCVMVSVEPGMGICAADVTICAVTVPYSCIMLPPFLLSAVSICGKYRFCA